jgi:hypothetical protein
MVRDSSPIDIFRVGDHIKVIYPKSKHYGRTGVVTRVSDPRLSVRFDDPRPGSYVDYKYARLMTTTQPARHGDDGTIEDWMTAVSEDVVVEDNTLVSLMENLALQTAVSALAESNNMADVERAIDEQA